MVMVKASIEYAIVSRTQYDGIHLECEPFRNAEMMVRYI